MTKQLSTFAGLATELVKNTVTALVAAEAGLARAAKIVQEDAKGRVGSYQQEAGPFPAWAPLAESTESEKEALGYPTGAPLLRTGDLRESIKIETSPLQAIIGSRMKIAAYQEFGTERMPPRPFLGPAAFSNQMKIVRIIGTYATAGLAGQRMLSQIGYSQSVRRR